MGIEDEDLPEEPGEQEGDGLGFGGDQGGGEAGILGDQTGAEEVEIAGEDIHFS